MGDMNSNNQPGKKYAFNNQKVSGVPNSKNNSIIIFKQETQTFP